MVSLRWRGGLAHRLPPQPTTLFDGTVKKRDGEMDETPDVTVRDLLRVSAREWINDHQLSPDFLDRYESSGNGFLRLAEEAYWNAEKAAGIVRR